MANEPPESNKKKIIVLVGEEFEVQEPKGGFLKAVAAGLVATAIATGIAMAVESGTAQNEDHPCPAHIVVPEPQKQ